MTEKTFVEKVQAANDGMFVEWIPLFEAIQKLREEIKNLPETNHVYSLYYDVAIKDVLDLIGELK